MALARAEENPPHKAVGGKAKYPQVRLAPSPFASPKAPE
jgi:hypothetical protein